MFVPTGTFVAVPLAIMQALSIHGAQHGGWPSAATMGSLCALDVALAHSIYDFDRLRDQDATTWGVYAVSTRLACVTAAAALCSREDTRTMSPLVPLLHARYADAKPHLASFKPVFVAALWGTATTFLPLFWDGLDVDAGALRGLMLLNSLQICALSNLADISDVDDDRAEGVRTPAVVLGPSAAYDASWAALVVAFALRLCHPWTDGLFLAHDAGTALLLAAYQRPDAPTAADDGD